MVQVDGAGSGGLVDPGVACWVGISGELGAREERGMSAWQFAVMKLARASASIEAFSALSIRGENDMTCVCVAQRTTQRGTLAGRAPPPRALAHGPTGSDMLTNKGLTRSTIHSN